MGKILVNLDQDLDLNINNNKKYKLLKKYKELFSLYEKS